MTPELIFIVATGGLAGLVGLGALVAVLRGWGQRTSEAASAPTPRVESAPNESPLAPSHEAVVRVVWWVAIAFVLVGVGISNAFPENQSAIYALGGGAVVIVVVLHEMLPRRWRGRITVGLEVVAALVLATGLVLLTGGAESPFVFTFHLLVVAAALTMGGRLALLVTAAASLAYIGQLALDGGLTTTARLLPVAINLGSVWLLAYLAGVYASSERRVRARMLELSQSDPLTGLFNRGALFPTLEQEVQRTRRSSRGFCVLMIDLDGLKAINDSLGHLRGDEVLRSVGRVINGSIRTVDSAYRYGGDEFLVLLPETEFIGAYVVAEKIREGVEQIGESLGTDQGRTSVSIGLISHPEDGSSTEELMVAADRAMYQAKSLGKNQISGNPRPRRVPAKLLAAPEIVDDTPFAEVAEPVPAPVAPPEAPDVAEVEPPPAATAFTIDGTATNGSQHHEGHGEDEPDPADVRRQIAAARRNMDPDHQIRRAMDAFLSSPTPSSAQRERGS
ncbi:MAG TPA: GGDEF domain-containing protein [Candidatus Limnocylindria bacterium]|nr:GGDEF domain-containing protein [Candidatus Limnocylindria bacterium]